MDSGGHNSVHSMWEKSSAMFLVGWTHASVQGLAPGKRQEWEPCRVCVCPRPLCALTVDTALPPSASAFGPGTRRWHPYARGVTGGEQNEMMQVRGQAMERP